MRAKRIQFHVRTPQGLSDLPVSALQFGNLCVHRRILNNTGAPDLSRDCAWRVSHVASGIAIPGMLDSQRDARKVAEYLARFDWSPISENGEHPDREAFKALGERCRAAVEAVTCGRDPSDDLSK